VTRESEVVREISVLSAIQIHISVTESQL